MTNEIRPISPVITEGQHLVFEVNVEQGVEFFTWIVFSNDGDLVEIGGRDRTNVAEDKRNEAYSFTSESPLAVGNYHLRLFPTDVDRDLLDDFDADSEAVFAVIPEGASAGQGTGSPVQVNLVADRTNVRRVAPDRFLSFAGFRAFVEGDEAYAEAFRFPTFGPLPYRTMRDAARAYVRQSAVHDFSDLVPDGYEDDRKEAEPNFPPLAMTDPDAGVLPGVELIWNYWEEEGMLVQTLNLVLARFQNRRVAGRDPLARFDVTPLLPLRNLLWGFAEDEVHRMTVRRRAAEYEYEYGLPLIGRAVPRRGHNVESRSGFLEAFHQVLFQAHGFFKERDDLTVSADAFPLFRALRDCHLVLSQGAQNQFGEMAVAARAEFLVMQQLLAEPQMREFLGGRPMTPYPEPWMDRVDTMKSIQGWPEASVMHYHDLATLGEQLVLTIRLGNWTAPGVGAAEAGTWAGTFRPAIQQYAAAYRTVTGVDLARTPDATLPSTLIARRLTGQRQRA